jgi:hypothetical protein
MFAMKDRPYPDIVVIIEELLQATDQLTRHEDDPQIDVQALMGYCADRLVCLQKTLSPQTSVVGGPPGATDPSELSPQVATMLKNLELATQRCIASLVRGRERAEGELAVLRHTQKAFRAYHNLR